MAVRYVQPVPRPTLNAEAIAISDPSDGAPSPLAAHGPLLALGIVALAIVLRAPGIAEWWLNPDEGIYFSILTYERLDHFWVEAMSTAHPPLYFLILRAIGRLSTDFVWLRTVALVSGCAAVYVFILVGRELGGLGTRGWLAGLAAGLLLAVSPGAIVLSQVIRPYMLLTLLLAGSLLFLLRYLRQPSTRRLIAHASCSAVAVCLHYSSALALGVIGVLVVADGVQRGFSRPEWRRLVAAQALPAAALGTMYVWQLRAFLNSVEASNTLECCLSIYMVRSPTDAWLGLVGFHSMLAGGAFAVSASLFTLTVLGWAAWTRAWRPLVTMASGLAVAVAGSVAQLYPLGPTRHGAWLLVFVVPVLAWGLATMLTAGRRAQALSASLILVLAAGAAPLTSVLDSERRPRDVSERVLRRSYVSAMQEVLDPQAEPELVLMSTETYRVLIPLYWRERQTADASSDGLLNRFRWGARHVIVMPGRDFASLPSQVGQPNHLYTAMRAAEEDFGIVLPENGRPLLVLAGGYESQGMADLVELSRRVGTLGTTTSVPGLIALALDVEAYERALADSGA